jgi:hypothetical protein
MLGSSVRRLKDQLAAIKRAVLGLEHVKQAAVEQELSRLRSRPKCADPKHLAPYGAKVYCQCDEDGIIAEIFRRIGTTNKCFIEFGIGDGLENNTHALLFQDWHGLWMDANARSIQNVITAWPALVNSGKLKVVETFITAENINELIRSNIDHQEIDYLGVDIDGNDYHVLNAIDCVSARVIVIEYNSKFAPPIKYCMKYNSTHGWREDDSFGASLSFFEERLQEKNYALVGCSLTGANAFFVRADLVKDKFFAPYTAENHYEPSRHYLAQLQAGHTASFAALANSINV